MAHDGGRAELAEGAVAGELKSGRGGGAAPARPRVDALQDLTELCRAWRAGDEAAGARLIERLYPWLRSLARRKLRELPATLTLEVDDLLHEAYLRLADRDHDAWNSRADFVALAVTVVRRVLVDQIRHRRRAKRGRGVVPLTLSAAERALAVSGRSVDFIDLDRALDRMTTIDAVAARLVELRFFGGFSVEEAADQLQIGRSTAVRSWRWARAWLRVELGIADAGAPERSDEAEA